MNLNFLKLFLESLKILKNKKIFALFGIEFLFFLLLMILALVTVTSVAEDVNQLRNFQQEFTVDENASANYLYENLLSLSNILNDLIKIVIAAFIILFFISGLFNGILWKASVNLIHGKPLFKDYNKRYFLNFFLLTFIWFVAFAGVFYLLYQYGFSYGVFAIILILFFYSAWINFSCYALDKNFSSIMRGFVFAIKKLYIFVPAFVLLAVILFLGSYAFGVFNNFFVSFLASIFLVFIFAWFRIFLITICGEQDSKPAKKSADNKY
ncbi:hypothetical protein HYV89_04750 [Candidatus Woesearchaeota archaeon]|nr:hypothetical protein [Candidatus Woesearchaeota archaeon]